MSKREDIIDGKEANYANGGLIYTEVLGWVDLGHARGDDIRSLLEKIRSGELSGNEFYNVTYSQGMTAPYGIVRSGKMATWRIRRGRPSWEQRSIALSMMMTVAWEFENFQNSFPSKYITDSGFSCEDLVSDLLGFYRVVSTPHPFDKLRPVSKAAALRRWDYYGKIGSFKVKTFTPLLFPDPEKSLNAQPYNGVLPSFMKTVMPYNDLRSGNVMMPKQGKTFISLSASSARMGL